MITLSRLPVHKEIPFEYRGPPRRVVCEGVEARIHRESNNTLCDEKGVSMTVVHRMIPLLKKGNIHEWNGTILVETPRVEIHEGCNAPGVSIHIVEPAN